MILRQRVCVVSNAMLFFISVVLIVAGIVVLAKIFPDMLSRTVKKEKVLGVNADGTLNDFTKSWTNPSYISVMEYHVFDYKNTISILNRALNPDVDEKGPYTYDEINSKTNLTFTENGEQMQYAESSQFIFNPKKSCRSCNPKKDTVTIPDISFFIGMTKIDALVEKTLGDPTVIEFCQMIFKDKCVKVAEVIEREVGTFMTLFGVSPFTTVTVHQLLFSGYVSPLITKLADRIIQMVDKLLGIKLPPFDRTAFTVVLNSNNGTTDTLYYAHTGKTDASRVGYIESFTNMNSRSLPSDGGKLPAQWWPAADSPTCNGDALVIEGTNGDFFKPFLKKTEQLPIYVSDICRSAKLSFEKEVEVQGIVGYRYLLPASEFEYFGTENCGFCNPNTMAQYGAYDRPPNSSCLPSGLLDISGCQKSPVIISKPHFYEASDVVQSFVPRFKPKYENDETTLDIEPITGTLLAANKRLQINVLLNQFSKIGAYSVLRPAAYPLVWLNESFLIDEGSRNELESSLFRPRSIVKAACWCVIGVGGPLLWARGELDSSVVFISAVYALQTKLSANFIVFVGKAQESMDKASRGIYHTYIFSPPHGITVNELWVFS